MERTSKIFMVHNSVGLRSTLYTFRYNSDTSTDLIFVYDLIEKSYVVTSIDSAKTAYTYKYDKSLTDIEATDIIIDINNNTPYKFNLNVKS